ncbi:hypothetical protein AVEN_83847-1 [Araneus ventricosus]|uniref:Uncharacterized protein n=1 Tax=Araneus ventricosus TaxID=182803 RepID=A0A4Y2RXX8_ARAVE|nr:hypothetical protein AVEN_83847-1 [Araneus ventricosus]
MTNSKHALKKIFSDRLSKAFTSNDHFLMNPDASCQENKAGPLSSGLIAFIEKTCWGLRFLRQSLFHRQRWMKKNMSQVLIISNQPDPEGGPRVI